MRLKATSVGVCEVESFNELAKGSVFGLKEYASPEIEFVDFEAAIFTTQLDSSDCDEDEGYTPGCGYVCPDEYGNTCTGNPYNGT